MSGAGEQKRGRFAVPLGLLSFAALVYLGFIRDETTNTTDLLQPPEHLQQRGKVKRGNSAHSLRSCNLS